jgi:hypothetical protein
MRMVGAYLAKERCWAVYDEVAVGVQRRRRRRLHDRRCLSWRLPLCEWLESGWGVTRVLGGARHAGGWCCSRGWVWSYTMAVAATAATMTSSSSSTALAVALGVHVVSGWRRCVGAYLASAPRLLLSPPLSSLSPPLLSFILSTSLVRAMARSLDRRSLMLEVSPACRCTRC